MTDISKLTEAETKVILAKYAKIKERERNQSLRYRARVNLILKWAKEAPGYKEPGEEAIKAELNRLASLNK